MLTGALTVPDEKVDYNYDPDDDPYQDAIDNYEMYGCTEGPACRHCKRL
jgi:hypothetical protein